MFMNAGRPLRMPGRANRQQPAERWRAGQKTGPALSIFRRRAGDRQEEFRVIERRLFVRDAFVGQAEQEADQCNALGRWSARFPVLVEIDDVESLCATLVTGKSPPCA